MLHHCATAVVWILHSLNLEDSVWLASMEPAFAFIAEGGCLYLPSAVHYTHKFHALSKSN